MLVPGAVEDLLARDDPARLERKAGEDVELLAGQSDEVTVDVDASSGEVDAHPSVLDRVAVGSRSSQHRAHAGRELVEPERFDDVVVGAGIERFDTIVL